MINTKSPTLGYHKFRGLVAPVNYMLAHCHLTYDTTFYDREEWDQVKDTMDFEFTHLPYLIDEDVKVNG